MKQIEVVTIFLIFGVLIQSVQSQVNDCIEPFSSYDTITTNGNYIKYLVKEKSAKLEYGNENFNRVLPELYSCEIADARVPKFKWDNNDFICLGYGCGSPCWGVLILPLNSKDCVRKIMYDKAWDPGKNILVYIGGPEYENLIVENIKTKMSQIIEISKKCSSIFLGYCIDSVAIRNNELYYRFVEPNIFDKNKRLTEYRIRIQ